MAAVLGEVGRSWWLFLIYGLIAIAFGVACMVWPIASVLALVWSFGILSLADGIVTLISAFRRDISLPRWLLILYSLTSIIFGVLAIAQPLGMAEAMFWVLAIWLVIAGVARIVMAIRVRKEVSGEWMLALSGVLAIVLGGLFLAMPGVGMLTVLIWIAAGALVYGALQVALAFRMRKDLKPLAV